MYACRGCETDMPDAGNGGDLCLNTQPRPHQESRLLLFLFFFLFLGISAARVSAEFASLRRSPASRAGGEFLPSPGVVTAVRGWGGGGGGGTVMSGRNFKPCGGEAGGPRKINLKKSIVEGFSISRISVSANLKTKKMKNFFH